MIFKLKYSDSHQILAHEVIFEEICGCTEQCPFCMAQCELSNPQHPTRSKCSTDKQEVNHSTQHRPGCLGGGGWKVDNTMVLDTCTSLVASGSRFRTEKNKWLPYKKYKEIFPDWSIPADKSLESSLFWKWLVGHYSAQIKEFYGRAEADIPDEWRELEWRNVKEWLKTEYNL